MGSYAPPCRWSVWRLISVELIIAILPRSMPGATGVPNLPAGKIRTRLRAPEQRQQLSETVAARSGTLSEADSKLMETQAICKDWQAVLLADTGGTGYRLSAASCLFTYNSATLSGAWWEPLLAWLQILDFSCCGTATLETSLRSSLEGRLHLHVFLELAKPVDWMGLRAVTFNGVQQATARRGVNMTKLQNHGRLYVYADKACVRLSKTTKVSKRFPISSHLATSQVSTLMMAASGCELWKDYARALTCC